MSSKNPLYRALLTGLLLCLAVSGHQAFAAAPLAITQNVTGAFQAQRPGVAQPLTMDVQSALFEGDLARTAPQSRAVLLFNDGAKVFLDEDTIIALISGHNSVKTPSGDEVQVPLRLVRGHIHAEAALPGLSVQTTSATAAVRGTSFDLRVDGQGMTTLAVLEGSVEFFNPFGQVAVGSLQQSHAAPGSAPSVPITIGRNDIQTEWTLDLNRLVIPHERFYISLDRALVERDLPARAARAAQLPNEPAAHVAYGDALFDDHQYGTARREYQTAHNLEPQQPAILTRLGYALLELNRLDAARDAFQSAAPAPVVQPVADVLDVTEFNSASALTGLAWVALLHDRPDQAELYAANATLALTNAAVPTDEATRRDELTQAYVAWGVALLREAGQLPASVEKLQSAAKLPNGPYSYQAYAWLSLAYQASGDATDSVREAATATRLEPFSALAHGHAALVYFFTDEPLQAIHEAKRAAQLDPQSVAAQLARGQALLAQGDASSAAHAAAYAVALDPSLPQAQYLLGVAQLQLRDYVHAARDFKAALRLAPDFLPAASALAIVYNRMGQPAQAVALLTDLAPRYPHSNEVVTALGAVYYDQGDYAAAIGQYQQSLKQQASSPLAYAGLARALLYSNHLTDAIHAAQQAVRLAPQVANYHALLGQAYDFSHISVQSEREYRAALSLDPQNALARALIALRATDPTTTLDTFSQAFLYNPAVSRQLLRGGINTETTPQTGTEGTRSLSLLHRDSGADGRFNFLGGLGHSEDKGDPHRPNDDTSGDSYRQDSTYIPNGQSNLYFNLSHARNAQGLPSLTSSPFGPDLFARSTFGFDQGQAALRHALPGGHAVWLGLTYQRLSSDLNRSGSPLLPFPISTGSAFSYDFNNFSNHALIPEVRADFSLSPDPHRPFLLTLGAAQARLRPYTNTGPLALFTSAAPILFPPSMTSGRETFSVAYAQLSRRASNRFAWTAQLRAQRDSLDLLNSGGTLAPGTQLTTSSRATHFLPSLLTTYQLNQQTTLRLIYNQRANTTNLAFAPTETRLTTEPDILPRGSPARSNTLEMDAERYLPHNAFLKLFLFRAAAQDVALGSDAPVYAFRVSAPVTLGHLQQTGLGIRYEQPISPNLYGALGLTLSHTNNQTPSAPFNRAQAPYYPIRTADAALNYVDGAGNKVTFVANYFGAFFEDRPSFYGLALPTSRPQFPSHVYFTLQLAKEPSVHSEVFVGVTNLFNAPGVTFNAVPTLTDQFGTGRRRLYTGVTRRF